MKLLNNISAPTLPSYPTQLRYYDGYAVTDIFNVIRGRTHNIILQSHYPNINDKKHGPK
jgi:hypothetical protein